MWTYFQCNGLLISEDGLTTLHCYAGMDEGKNNPDMEGVKMKGPLPRGKYRAEAPFDSKTRGPFAMRLEPYDDNDMLGRSAFMYHADSIKNPGKASNGCIVSIGTPQISGRKEREIFWKSGDPDIEVKSGLSERLI